MSLLKDKLKSKLSKKDLEKMPSSFDVVGDIAIIEIRHLKGKDKLIADTILDNLSNIKVVAKKVGEHKGKYRLQKLKIIGGEKRKETLHKESGVLLKLDVEKCYFSERLSSERLRIAKLVKLKERVLVMFSGIGVYCLVIARNSKVKEIYGVEANPVAHKYALDNLKLNKFENIFLYKGDVRKVIPKMKFDRIIMPYPKEAPKFLELALKYIKNNGTIHLYTFEHEEKFEELRKCYLKKFKSVKLNKCGAYAPRVDRVCLDLKL